MAGQILKTSSYTRFNSMRGNRKVSERHVRSLVNSISNRNLLAANPILVDEAMNVIDGQHRLEAARKLNTPIYYIWCLSLIETSLGTSLNTWLNRKDNMSNYRATAIHPVTGKLEIADFLDDYFGHHKYGVRFVGEDHVHPIGEIEYPMELGIEDGEALELSYKMYTDQDFKLKLVDNMNIYGGSFVQALSAATMRADKENLRKLVQTFYEYFKKYSEWGSND